MLDSTDRQPLEYASPDDAPNVDGLLDAARYTALIGAIIPLAALGGIAWAIFALCQDRISAEDRTRALRIIAGSCVILMINSGVLAFFLLLMSAA